MITAVHSQERATQTMPDGTHRIINYCGQQAARENFFRQHPGQRKRAKKASQKLEKRTARFNSGQEAKGTQTEYIIPVVFHVIHYGGDENISFEQIQNAVEVMTADFHAQDAQIDEVVPEFEGDIGNIGITFKLARYDPDGNCTNGVVRVKDEATYDGGENLKQISPGWDRANYLNIWVTESIGSGAAGYSKYPSTVDGPDGEFTDGIVALYDYVGAIGQSSPYRSHTLSHEAGHWLNLAHTWGSSNNAEEQGNCNIDDGVDDTPNTLGHSTCELDAATCGSLDNVQNYMDYSYCTNMFTVGQKNRVIAALTSSIADRNQLWSSENLAATGVLQEPVLCKADFEADKKVICVGESVQFSDLSYSNVTTWNWTFEGAAVENFDEQNPQPLYETPGVYSVTLEAGNGTSTVSTSKNEFIRVLPEEGEPIPYSENFENTSEIPNDSWYLSDKNHEVTWGLRSAGLSGDNSIGIINYDKPGDQKERIISSVISIPDSLEVLYISYKVAYRQRNEDNNDKLRLLSSPDCGNLWLLRDQIQGDDLASGGPQYSFFTPDSPEDWKNVVVDNTPESSFTGQFRIMFWFKSDEGNNIFVDDINIATQDVSGNTEVHAVDFDLYPNPSAGQSNLNFALDQSSEADIAVYDLAGRRVKTISKGILSAGVHKLHINTGGLKPGMYIIRMTGKELEGSAKLIVD